MKNRTLLLLFFCSPIFIQCTQVSSSSEGQKEEVLESLANGFALTQFMDFQGRASDLETAIASFCEAPTEETWVPAQKAWKEARITQKRFQIIQFGPIKEYPLRLGPLLDTWPVNEAAIETLVEEESPLTQEAFESKGSKHRGMPVLEYLLWTGEPDTWSAMASDGRRCEVLQAVAKDLVFNGNRLVTSWEEDWIPQLTGVDPEGQYKTLDDAMDEWVNRMAFTVENIRINKLEKPAGYPKENSPKPDVLESPYSDHSLEDAIVALEGVALVWAGDESLGTEGVSTLVNSLSLRLNMNEALENAKDALSQIPAPLSESIETGYGPIMEARTALKDLQGLLQGEVASQVGVKLSFNDGDGD